MKYKTTRRAIVNGSPRLVSVGYCDAAALLWNHAPVAYTCGTYGWDFDVYEVDGLTICTGYRGMPGRTANNVHEFERRARLIKDDYSRDTEERRAEVEKILHEFIAQA